MLFQYSLCEGFDFTARNLVQEVEARRQEAVVREILLRLQAQPGLILAEQHGAVLAALTVAASVTLSDPRNRPVVVIAPPSEEEKWHLSFDFFRQKCLPLQLAANYRYSRAEDLWQFLKLLDDSEGRKRSLIFLTPSSFEKKITDGWMRLALLQQALLRINNPDVSQAEILKLLGALLPSLRFGEGNFWGRILDSNPRQWQSIFNESVADSNRQVLVDDPVPVLMIDVLDKIDLSRLSQSIQEALAHSENDYRRKIHSELRTLSRAIMTHMNVQLPLLVFDNAGLLKNKRSKLSDLFRKGGPLSRVFDRMLFLARVPFNMDPRHISLVLQKFEHVAWDTGSTEKEEADFRQSNKRLRRLFQESEDASTRLEIAWTFLGVDDLVVGDQTYHDIDGWVAAVEASNACPVSGKSVLKLYLKAKKAKETARKELHKWILEM